VNRAALEAVAAVLVPPAAGLPGAREAGVAGGIDAVLDACPRLRPPLPPALDALAAAASEGEPELTRALARMERERPEQFTALLEAVVAAWALSPAVWEALGYAGQRDLDPAGLGTGEDLLAPVLERGRRWSDVAPASVGEGG